MNLGSHTGERINEKYDEVLREYGIAGKVSFVITDNASNMKAAFNVSFPIEETDEEEDGIWQDATIEEDTIKTERISCFAHSLQLTVLDGLKETKAASRALSKATKISTLLHRSCSFKVLYSVNVQIESVK